MSKRKAYRPKAVMLNPLASVVPMSTTKRNKLELYYLTAIAAVANGSYPGIEEWRSLADIVNVVETLVFQGKLLREEILPDVVTANEAMRAAAKRYQAGHGMRLSGVGLSALREIAAVHTHCLTQLTEREIEQAIAETRRAIVAVQRDRPSTVIQL